MEKKKKTRPFKFHTKSAERISSCPLNSWLVRCGRTVLLQVLCSTPEENSQSSDFYRLIEVSIPEGTLCHLERNLPPRRALFIPHGFVDILLNPR